MITAISETPIPNDAAARPYSERHFGSVNNVCLRLRDAIRDRREQKKLPRNYLDTVCGFGSLLPKKGIKLPTCSEFEENPEKHMNSLVFSLASFPLGLNIDDVLPVALNRDERVQVAEEMRIKKAGAKRGAGGPDPSRIPYEDQAEIYVLSRILAELDERLSPAQ